jgi:hypothetical protein
MMGKKERVFSPLPRNISLEDFVPENNFYRRLEKALDLSFTRNLVHLYDYVPGKADWFASGFPKEGRLASVPTIGQAARRDVPTCLRLRRSARCGRGCGRRAGIGAWS